jgi:hypothetical protein
MIIRIRYITKTNSIIKEKMNINKNTLKIMICNTLMKDQEVEEVTEMNIGIIIMRIVELLIIMIFVIIKDTKEKIITIDKIIMDIIIDIKIDIIKEKMTIINKITHTKDMNIKFQIDMIDTMIKMIII